LLVGKVGNIRKVNLLRLDPFFVPSGSRRALMIFVISSSFLLLVVHTMSNTFPLASRKYRQVMRRIR
jgi:hypothetical protein